MTKKDIKKEQAQIDREIEGKTTGDLLKANAERHKDAPAMSYRDGERWRRITWGEVRERVAELAMGFKSLGVAHGDYVALMSVNRPEHVLADQGAVHAGATGTTFYSTLAPEQVEYVANNCGCKVAVLGDRSFLERWLPVRDKLDKLETIVMMEDADQFANDDGIISYDELVERGKKALEKEGREAFEASWKEVKPDDPATLIYTSGTTGPPKGVVLTHRNCLYETSAITRLVRVREGYTGVSYLPLAHIAERILSVYLPLFRAAHIYYCPDPKQAVDYVKEAQPTTFFGVPRVWEKIRSALTAKVESAPSPIKRWLGLTAIETGKQVVACQQADRDVPLLLGLKHSLFEKLVLGNVRAALGLDRCEFCASAAAPLPVDVSEFFAALGLPIIEVYGMTETTGVCTGNPPERIKIGSVGPALYGVEVKLADDGEVLARGPNNTPGYLNRPEATAELLDDDGWLHTGDVGELDDDGYLKIVDRKKELIITAAGKNLSPANIESLLKQHPVVGQALAFGDRKPYVVALIVLDSEVAPTWAEQNGIEFESVAALADHPKVQAAAKEAVDECNTHLARVEQIKKFKVLPAEWTAESEELTPTLKLKRRVIHDKYKDEIEALYAS
ncbi:MAG: long-chain fatty acid--CoA ligase [Deltaproteobacteria bacterium]|jgi:long-chain acyl-CoA synthetase|nr:long-chain fatty acid--CoA ligase [Deltaproteobacteria bacterium]MBW2534848.1 long-chain fatty acid--CoA ligase [Deltaproteobacteria bacterium]